jgi:Calcineurin-like phosphoesterase
VSERILHRVCGAFVVMLSSIVAADAAPRGGVEAAFVLLGPQGAVGRAVLRDAVQCPAIELDGTEQPMQIRARADAGVGLRFPVTVCEKLIPPETRSASVAGQLLPLPAARLEAIVVLGDTGCRMKAGTTGKTASSADTDESEDGKFQDCNDPSQWPFGAVSSAAAASKPDLVIHVGDYLYRESSCPAGDRGCAGSPFGDDWAAWKADFFMPAAPLLAAAPWIMARGNHEICKRGGAGYFRFLDPTLAGDRASPSCLDQIPPYTVTVSGRSFIVLDSSNAPDSAPTSADVQRYAAQFSVLRPAAGSWLVTHRPIWGVKSEKSKSNGKRQLVILNETLEKALATFGGALPAGIDLVLSGHIHLWEAIGFADKRPPQFVLGSGGTDLAHAIKGALNGLPMGGAHAAFGRSEHVWGFTRFTPADAGSWDATFFDEKSLPRANCTVARGEVGCK